jgi:hypothetical protein
MALNRVGLPDDYGRADFPDMRLIQDGVRKLTEERATPYVIPAQQLPSLVAIYRSLATYLNDHDDAQLATTGPYVSPDMYTKLIDWLNSHAPYNTHPWPYRLYGREHRLRRSYDDDVVDGIARWAPGPTDLSRLRL